MKQIFLIIALFSIATGSAQTREDIPRPNDLSVSVGIGSLAQIIGGLSLSLSKLGNDDNYKISDDQRSIPSINVSYGYQVTPLVNIGVTASYTQISESKLFIDTQKKAGYNLIASPSLMPTARFDWLRRKYFRCYSKIGCGVTYYLSKEVYDAEPERNSADSQIITCLDAVPLGVVVGGKVYGFAEAGIGSIGFLKAGIGCRF